MIEIIWIFVMEMIGATVTMGGMTTAFENEDWAFGLLCLIGHGIMLLLIRDTIYRIDTAIEHSSKYKKGGKDL